MESFDSVLSRLAEVLSGEIGADQALRDWNKNYFNNARKRYRSELDMLQPYLFEGCKVLEVGSSPYHLTWVLQELGVDITGVDIAPERFSDFVDALGIKSVKCNVETEKMPFDDNSFDLVIFNEVFEHMRIDLISTMKELNRVLKKDGVLMLSTPNLYSIQNLVRIALGRGFDNPYEEFNKLHTIGHMGHVREYSVKQVKVFLNNTGFRPEVVHMKSYNKLRGMWSLFNPVRAVFKGLHTFQVHFSKKK